MEISLIEEKVLALINRIVFEGSDEAEIDESLSSYYMNEVDVLDLIMSLEREFGISIEDSESNSWHTNNCIVTTIINLTQTK